MFSTRKFLIVCAVLMSAAPAALPETASAGDVILSRRSIRRFSRERVPRIRLEGAVRAGSLAAASGNIQPWQFIIIDEPEIKDGIFPLLGWLGGAPTRRQRPAAYIAMLMEKTAMDSWSQISSAGAAFQNIMLYAWAHGVGSCCFGSVRRDEASELLGIPEGYHLFVVIALGFPEEEPEVEEAGDSLRPYRDDEGVLRVPKRPLEEILHYGRFGGSGEK